MKIHDKIQKNLNLGHKNLQIKEPVLRLNYYVLHFTLVKKKAPGLKTREIK